MIRATRFAWMVGALGLGGLLATGPIATLGAQSARDGAKAGPARFADPQRRATLESALPEIDRIFREFAERSRVPGIGWGVILDGELVRVGTAGYRDLAAKAPVTSDTVFRIASMTKSFTAMAILRLRDEGKLSLDDPAERYVPEMAGLPYPTTDSPRITIRHLLSHSEGFPEDNPWGDQQLAATEDEMTEMIRRGIPFSNPPGLAYEYSNFGFAILGRVVSRVSGQPYRDYVEASVLRPLGMAVTTLERASVPSDRLAHGYRWEDATWKEEPLLPDGAFGSMGGMMTSIGDLGRYVAFLMAAWPPRDGPETGPIRRASAREMQQVWRPAPAAVTRRALNAPVTLNAGGYGFGLRIAQTCEFGQVVSHSGGLPGFGSQMRWLPDYGVGIVALGNLTYTSWGAPIDRAMAALRQTGALRPRAPQPAPVLLEMQAAVSRLVTGWDDELASRIAAVNLFLDRSADRRKREFDQLRARHGVCRASGGIDAENALRGEWTMACDRGALRVGITLAPTMPPTVQYLEARSIMPMSGPMAGVVGEIVALLPGGAASSPGGAGGSRPPVPIGDRLAPLLAPTVDRLAAEQMIAAASPLGGCRVGDVQDGDGERSTRVRLACAHGAADLSVVLDEAGAKVTRLVLAPPGGSACGQ